MARARGHHARSCVSGALALLALVAPTLAAAAPLVWAVDDGEKIKQTDTASPLATGAGNPVWSPGKPIRLFSARNETVAIQIVVGADAALEGVTVELDALTAEGGASLRNAPGANDPASYVGRPIERFVEHFFTIARPSSGRLAAESLGWAAGSGPPPTRWLGPVPDALIPVEIAPPWSPYPMTVAPHTNGIVWIDITVPKTQPPAVYRGAVVVKARGETMASLPVELDIADIVLPDRPVRTMVYYDRDELDRRMVRGDAAEQQLWRLFHRHRLSPLHGATTPADVTRRLLALDGSLYTPAHAYEGPGEGMGDGVLALGTYGTLGAPDASKLAVVEAIADRVAKESLFATTDTFVYAIDEACESPYGATWKRLLEGSTNANVKRVRVGATCSQDPSRQSVDIAIVHDTFDPRTAAAARALGKEVWVYNGRQPFTGTFLTDAPAVAPRVNGWLLGMFDIGRWFFWESTFWFDDNRGGRGAYDPFTSAETFHNQDHDLGMGDGVLVYPGTQVGRFAEHSIGLSGVVASIRMKNWRRGIEDAGYYQLAHDASPAKAEAIARGLLPRVLSAASAGATPSWPDSGAPYFEARRALRELVPVGANGGRGAGAKPSPNATPLPPPAPPTEPSRAPLSLRMKASGAAALGLLAILWLFARRRRRR